MVISVVIWVDRTYSGILMTDGRGFPTAHCGLGFVFFFFFFSILNNAVRPPHVAMELDDAWLIGVGSDGEPLSGE